MQQCGSICKYLLSANLCPASLLLLLPLCRIDGVLNGAVELAIVKVFGDSCAWTYASSLVYAMQRCQAMGARIVSVSLGGGGASVTESDEINKLYNAGMLLIAAAGNSGTSAVSYPAGYASVISVAAVDSNAVKASFSQFNADVELSAPGVNVLSSVNRRVVITGTQFSGTAEGQWMEGSSRPNITSTLVARCTISSTSTTCPSTALGKGLWCASSSGSFESHKSLSH